MNQQGPDKPIFEDYTKETKDFMQDPTDFSDPVAEARRRERMKKILAAVAALIILLALGGGTYYLLHKDSTDSTSEKHPNSTATPTVNQGDAKTPLLNQYKNAPTVTSGATNIKVSKEGVAQDSSGHSLTLKGKKIFNPSEDCTVTDPTDFCLTGLVQDNNTDLDVYYLKDAVHSRLFEGNNKYTPLHIAGSPAAGALPLNIGGANRQAMVMANRDSSGWMLVLKKGDLNQIASIAQIK